MNDDIVYHLFNVDGATIAVPAEKSVDNVIKYWKEYGVSTIVVVRPDGSQEVLMSGDCGKFVNGQLIRLNYEARFIG